MCKYSTEVGVLEKTLDRFSWFLFVVSLKCRQPLSWSPDTLKTFSGNIWMSLRWSDSDYLSELIWNASSVNAVSETKGFLQVARFVSRLSKGFLLSLWSATVHSYSNTIVPSNCFLGQERGVLLVHSGAAPLCFNRFCSLRSLAFFLLI